VKTVTDRADTYKPISAASSDSRAVVVAWPTDGAPIANWCPRGHARTTCLYFHHRCIYCERTAA
jgi:hypothetical protein